MLNLLDNDQTIMIPPPSLVLHHHVGSTLTSTIPVVTSGRGEEPSSLFTPLEMNLVNSLRLPARGGSKTSGCAPRLARGWQQPSGRRYSSPGHRLPTQQLRRAPRLPPHPAPLPAPLEPPLARPWGPSRRPRLPGSSRPPRPPCRRRQVSANAPTTWVNSASTRSRPRRYPPRSQPRAAWPGLGLPGVARVTRCTPTCGGRCSDTACS